MTQLRLPMWTYSCYYECVNPNCFYCETQMSYEDVNFKHKFNHREGDLELVPYCPSCDYEVIFWQGEDTIDPV